MGYVNYYGLKTNNRDKLLSDLFKYKKELVKRNKTKEDIKYKTMDFHIKEYMEEGMSLFDAKRHFQQQFEINKRTPILIYESLEDLTIRVFSNNLMIPHFIGVNIYQELLELNSIEEYGYWNNVDKPDNIPYEIWKNRGKIWEETATQDYLDIVIFKDSIDMLEYDRRYKGFD